MLSASPWITASTTVQNLKYHCRSIKLLQRDPKIAKYSFITRCITMKASDKIQSSQQKHKSNEPHLQACATGRHVGCRLESKQLFFIWSTCTLEYAAPEGGQYNEVLASDYGGYKMTSLNYMSIWLGGVVGYLQKASFLLSFVKHFYFQRLGTKGWSPSAPIFLSLVKILLHENGVEILPSILVQLLEVVHHRGHG